MGRRNGWFVGGFSTAAAIVVEQAAERATVGHQSKLILEGYSVIVGSSVASTIGITLRRGPSSASLLSSVSIGLTDGATVYSFDAHGLDISAGFFAIAAPTTSVTGVHATMWGHYA